ncbi:MAG: ATP-binding protein [Desulfobacterales bacterium]|nr:AAA family ATPase [Deltaproteobacteria bacterium]NNL43478.1 ATP-binding protein [Desulfobacterales bacterium]
MLDDIFKLSRNFLKTFNKPYRRYFLEKYPLESRFSIITGQRGVGKTTALIQKILSANDNDILSKNALYVPVDHVVVAGRSLYEIAEGFYNLGGQMICFDEIHKYAGWSGELKSIYDILQELTILASGSSAMEILKGSHDLSRRAIVYPMTGLSFREYIDFSAGIKTKPLALKSILKNHEKISYDIITSVESKKEKILALFKDYLQFGYFPYFMEFDDISLYYITLEQSMRTTIESDLLSIYPTLNGSSIKKIKRLLAVIAESAPFTPDLKRLKRIVEIGDERTLKSYLKYLEDGGVIISLAKKGGGLGALEKPEKIYLNNPNQIYAISSKGKENTGTIRETFFINMISILHKVSMPQKGDFCVDNKYIFEIGGKNKSFKQIKDINDSFLAIDDVEVGVGNKIPLWLFGFLY